MALAGWWRGSRAAAPQACRRASTSPMACRWLLDRPRFNALRPCWPACLQDLQDEVARIHAADAAGQAGSSAAASGPATQQQQQQQQQPAASKRRKRGRRDGEPPLLEEPQLQQQQGKGKKALAAHIKPLR